MSLSGLHDGQRWGRDTSHPSLLAFKFRYTVVFIKVKHPPETGVNRLSEQDRSAKISRAYRMSKRAELMDDTRQRIIEAAVDLHGTVGPAGTTISGIADRAGVTRVTVYRHFPDEVSLFAACSAHWFSQQQVPDPESWAEIDDPSARVRAALTDLYRFFRQGEPMLRRIRRDIEVVPESRRQAMKQMTEHQRDVLLSAFGGKAQAEAASRSPRACDLVRHLVLPVRRQPAVRPRCRRPDDRAGAERRRHQPRLSQSRSGPAHALPHPGARRHRTTVWRVPHREGAIPPEARK